MANEKRVNVHVKLVKTVSFYNSNMDEHIKRFCMSVFVISNISALSTIALCL